MSSNDQQFIGHRRAQPFEERRRFARLCPAIHPFCETMDAGVETRA
jgi:hypothetical protein